jgi:diacylglycerol kinase family enzyme
MVFTEEVDGLRVLVLHNPKAGEEDHEPESLIGPLEEAGHAVRWQSVQESGWEASLDEGADLVAVAGGDGTVRKVFRRLAGGRVPATILPVGTANNIARSLGIEEVEPGDLIRGWPKGRMRPCDIGSLGAGRGQQLFVESAGGGLFADLLIRAEDDKADSDPDDKIELGLEVLLATAGEAKARPWRVRLDGDELAEDLVGVEVMNVREAGPRLPLAPEADPGDGLLDVVLIRAAGAEALAAYAQARLRESPAEPPRFEVRRGREVVVHPPRDWPLHYDDEVLAERNADRAVVRCAGRLQVLVPSAEREREASR